MMLSSRPLRLDGQTYNISTAKTPGRAILKGRSALQENAFQNGSMTGNAKGKKVVLHTPFHPQTLQPQKLFKDPLHQGHSKSTTVAPTRPLGDKTPFTNRTAPLVTPLPNGSKISKLSVNASQYKTPGALLLPSSTRKHDRMPRSASKSFETPQTQGNHWDVSDTEIEGLETAAVNLSIEEEDYDEIEYMPPSAIEIPYQPMFDMPNYADVGQTLTTLARSYHFDDPPSFDSEVISIFPEEISHNLPLPELEDDGPFRLLHKPASIPPSKYTALSATNKTVAPRSTRSAPVTRPASRATGTKIPAGTRSASSSRPGIATSIPTTRPRGPGPVATGVPTTLGSRTTGAAKKATSTSTKSVRPVGNGHTIASQLPSRRPATSASTYHPVTMSSNPAVRRPGTSLRVVRPLAKAKVATNDDVVLKFETTVQEDDAFVDDFKFDI